MARPPLARILLVNATILLGGLVALELVFGGWIRTDRMYRLNLVRDRTIHYDASGFYTSAGLTTYTRDRWGLRGTHASPADIDVLTLGGSAADQRYITDGRTWQDVIQRLFAEEGRRVVVANGAVDGQSTHGHLRNFEWWLPFVPGLRPQYVLVYVGVNDMYRDAGDPWDRLLAPERRNWRARIEEKSALLYLVRTLRGWGKSRVGGLRHRREDLDSWAWTTEGKLGDVRPLMAGRVEEYRSRLRLLAARIRGFGARPIYVTQPRYLYRVRQDGAVEGNAEVVRVGDAEVNGVDVYRMMEMIHAATLEVCREERAVCFDAAREVAWTSADFYDSVHNTPAGAEKLGRYLHARLAPLIGGPNP